jgi:hypothetical protein
MSIINLNRHKKILDSLVFALLFITAHSAPANTKPTIILADFESGTWSDWTVEGTAFGEKPFSGTNPPQVLSGRKGEYAINTWACRSDVPTGKLSSKTFEISKPYLCFLLGGGKKPENVEHGVRLEIAGQVVHRAAGKNSDAMEWVNWDVSQYQGKTGRIIVEDGTTGPWGHVVADHFVLSSFSMPVFALASPFGDHMVLQREQQVVIWGRGLSGDTIRVSFAGQTKESRVDTSNQWRLVLDPMQASSKSRDFVVEVVGADNTVLSDVLVGDVWLCSGQSNMEMGVSGSANASTEMAAANFPMIREFRVQHNESLQPLDKLSGTWQVCSPNTVGNFSAAGYFFG